LVVVGLYFLFVKLAVWVGVVFLYMRLGACILNHFGWLVWGLYFLLFYTRFVVGLCLSALSLAGQQLRATRSPWGCTPCAARISRSLNQWCWRAAYRNPVLRGRKQQPSIIMSDDTMKLADHKSLCMPKLSTCNHFQRIIDSWSDWSSVEGNAVAVGEE